MKWSEKSYVIHTQSFLEQELLLGLLEPVVDRYMILLKTRLGKITIKLTGTKDEIIAASNSIKTIADDVKYATRMDSDGNYIYTSTFIYKISRTVLSLSTLSMVLNAIGYSSTVVKRGVKTNCPLSELKHLLLELNDLQQFLPARLSKPIKSILMVSSYLSKLNPMDLLDHSLHKGLFRETSQGLQITIAPEKIINELTSLQPEDLEYVYQNRMQVFKNSFKQVSGNNIIIKKRKKK